MLQMLQCFQNVANIEETFKMLQNAAEPTKVAELSNVAVLSNVANIAETLKMLQMLHC